MALALHRHPSFAGRPGPLLLVIADGVGIAPPGPSNAVTEADTPTLDALLSSPLSTSLLAHGSAVGLPSDDDMGNSEVGHNALGAGRIFAQGSKLVNRALADGTLFAETMIRQGDAIHYVYDGVPSMHADRLAAAEDAARASQVGLCSPRTCQGNPHEATQAP